MDLKLIFWVLFGALAGAIPVTLIKMYTESKQKFLLFLSILSYILAIISYVNVFEKGDIITFYIIMKILSDLLVIASGILFFSEKLTIKKGFGVLLALLSVYVISS
jgi:multidrug transporter EmrE-like cation transporter